MFTVVAGFLVLAGVLLVGLALVAHGTAAKNRWGINMEGVHCPDAMSYFRGGGGGIR